MHCADVALLPVFSSLPKLPFHLKSHAFISPRVEWGNIMQTCYGRLKHSRKRTGFSVFSLLFLLFFLLLCWLRQYEVSLCSSRSVGVFNQWVAGSASREINKKICIASDQLLIWLYSQFLIFCWTYYCRYLLIEIVWMWGNAAPVNAAELRHSVAQFPKTFFCQHFVDNSVAHEDDSALPPQS